MILPLADPNPAVAEFFAGVETLPALLARRATLTPSAKAFYTQATDGTWTATTWSEFAGDVAVLSEAFARHGVARTGRVGILAGTSLGWEAAQMAALSCGATVAGIDPYYPDALINELIAELGLGALIVENAAALNRVSPSNLDRLTFVALIHRTATDTEDRFPTLAGLRTQTARSADWASGAETTMPALVAFSSGSTGSPKPVLYTHSQVVHACRCILETYPEVAPGAHLVCWLPLANLFQRMINFCAAARGAVRYMVEDPRRVMDVVRIANPEIFVAVPRFCEKLHAGMMQRVEANALTARIVKQAMALGSALYEEESGGKRMSPLKRTTAALADRLILARLRAVMGARIKFIVSGSAPMPRWLLNRYSAIGVPVLEAYGVSENLVPVAANRLTDRKAGTVGKPVGDNDVRIASDGEVQVRGRGVFDATIGENRARVQALTEDGYLATGDLGYFDEEGFLTLHGRRAEAYKNAQGRWIVLAQIEAALRRLPGIEHAAAIKVDADRLIGVLALGQDAESAGPSDMQNVPATEDSLSAALRARLPHELATLPRAMWPAALLIVRAGFSPATGELTTNFKLRRSAIGEKFAGPLRALAARIEDPRNGAVDALPLYFL